ncbi:MAG: cellulose binding domain-containing protein, partial [Lachnospiraceae bacterium]|nr:cellulose binding domain-containing protein [Lachnospiraceae bacterium]
MKAGSGRKNHKLRVIMSIVLIISLISLIVTLIYAKGANKQVHSLSFDWSIDDPENEEIYIFATSGTPWSDKDAIGDQYDFRLVNNSRHAISNWSMVAYIPVGCDIDSSWNGLWAINQDRLIYEPADYNMYAAAGEQRTFGLVMYAPYVCDMNEITLEYTEAKKATAYPMFWISFLAGLIA